MMNPVFKEPWIEALESDRYVQGYGALYGEVAPGQARHCCLGVLAEIMGAKRIEGNDLEYKGYIMAGTLPAPVLNIVGLSDDDQHKLASMNDQGVSFREIAQHIREKL